MRLSLIPAAIAISSCTFAVDVPATTQLACESDDDCFGALTCRDGACVDETINDRPRLAVVDVSDRVDAASAIVSVVVSDDEGDDVVVGADGLVVDGDVTASRDGDEATLIVSGFADLDNAREETITLVPADDGGSGEGVDVVVVVGNAVPVPSVPEVAGGVVKGLAVVRFTAVDDVFSSLVLSGIDVDGVALDPFDADVFPIGLPALVAGQEAAIVWDSLVSHPVDADVDFAVTVTDDLGASATTTARFTIDNDSAAPVVTIVGPATPTVSGRVAFTVHIVDPDPDLFTVVPRFVVGADARGAEVVGATVNVAGPDVALEWLSDADGQVGAARAEDVHLAVTVSDGVNVVDAASDVFIVDNTALVGEVPPIVDVVAVGRAIEAGVLEVTVVDANGSAADPVPVDLEVAIVDDAGGERPAVVTAGALDDVDADIDGVVHTLTWNPLADGQLPLSSVDLDNDGQAEKVVPSTQQVRLKVTATDATGRRDSSVVVVDIGNDAPVVSVAQPLPVVSGRVALEIAVTDVIGDPGSDFGDFANVEVSFARVENGVAGTFHLARIVLGGVSGLATPRVASAEQPVPAVVVWDTTVGVNPDETQGSGVGVDNAEVEVRVVAFDGPFEGVSHRGVRSSVRFRVENQTPPRVEIVGVKSDGGGHFGLVPVAYRLVDEQGDAADIRVEASRDEGRSFFDVTEAPTLRSEGTRDLVTAAEVDGGALHTFVWDATADLVVPSSSTILRMRARDDGGESEVVEIFRQSPSGPGGGDATTSLFEAPTLLGINNVAVPIRGIDSIALHDLDDDGDVDVVAGRALGSDAKIDVRKNDGSGVFGGAIALDLVCEARAVAVGDVTCDGVVDIVAVTTPFTCDTQPPPEPGRLRVFAGTGGGNFSATPTLTKDLPFISNNCASNSNCNKFSLDVGDIDGNGRDDVVLGWGGDVSSVNITLSVFKNPNAGTCDLGTRVDVAAPTFIRSQRLADVDDDGVVDIVVAGSAGGVVRDAVVNGATLAVTTTTSTLLNDIALRAYGDVDGDQRDDVIDLAFSTASVRGGVVGGFGARGALTTIPVVGTRAVGADVTGDGVSDAIVASRLSSDQGLLTVLRGSPDGVVSTVQSIPLPAEALAVAVADLDGDGRDDVVTADEDGGRILLSTRRPHQSFAPPVFSQHTGATSVVVDADDDGFLDSFAMGDGFAIAKGVGFDRAPTSAFGSSVLVPGVSGEVVPRSSAVGDFDGDGNVDVAEILRVAGFLTVVVSFGPAHRGADLWMFDAPGQLEPQQITAGDIDGDGVSDVVIVFDNGAVVVQHPAPGVSDLTATLPTPLLNGQRGAPRLADVDDDGDLDVIALTQAAGVQLAVIKNVGGALSTAAPVTTNLSSGSVFVAIDVADLDADGFADVVGTAPGVTAGTTRLLLNRGAANGAFGATSERSIAGAFFGGVGAIDDDGDGDLEVVCGGDDGFVIVEFDPVFREVSRAALNDAGGRVAVVDVNGDLVPDVVSGGGAGVSVATGVRDDPRAAASRVVRVVVDAGNDRFGRAAPLPRITVTPFNGFADAFTGDARSSTTGADFTQVLRGQGLALAQKPLTRALTIGGDRLLKKIRLNGAVVTVADQRLDLDDDNRVDVDLPFLKKNANPGVVRVFGRFVDVEHDVAGAVPLVAGRERLRERDTFRELAAGEFDVDAAAGVVHLHVAELGTFQAFVVRP